MKKKKKLIVNHGSPEGSEYQKEKDLSTYNFIARKDSFQSQNKNLNSHKNSKRINQSQTCTIRNRKGIPLDNRKIILVTNMDLHRGMQGTAIAYVTSYVIFLTIFIINDL